MNRIADRIEAIRATLTEGVELNAVSKFHPVEALREAYDAGQRVFGESRVQELLAKIPQMPGDVRWHFIGHLQTNKVRQIVGRVALIESVDSERLLRLIDAESERAGVVSRVLMQVHVAREETKFGFLPEELVSWMAEGATAPCAPRIYAGLWAWLRTLTMKAVWLPTSPLSATRWRRYAASPQASSQASTR